MLAADQAFYPAFPTSPVLPDRPSQQHNDKFQVRHGAADLVGRLPTLLTAAAFWSAIITDSMRPRGTAMRVEGERERTLSMRVCVPPFTGRVRRTRAADALAAASGREPCLLACCVRDEVL